MIEVMTNAGGDEGGQLGLGEPLLQVTSVDEDIHHLGDAKAVPEIMERVLAITTVHRGLFFNIKKEEFSYHVLHAKPHEHL